MAANKRLHAVAREEFHRGMYARRNDKVCDVVKTVQHRRILDIAAGSTYIALRFVGLPEVEKYVWNELCVNALYMDELKRHSCFVVSQGDCMALLPIINFDVVICVSLEHIEHDLALVEGIASGTFCVFCSPDFPGKPDPDFAGYQHFRIFSSVEKFEERYSDYLDIQGRLTLAEKEKQKWAHKFLIWGRRK